MGFALWVLFLVAQGLFFGPWQFANAAEFKQALVSAGSPDREKLRDALSRLKTRELTSGIPIEFDKNGARKEYMYFLQILSVDGKRTYKSKQIYYNEWDAEVIPVYDLVK